LFYLCAIHRQLIDRITQNNHQLDAIVNINLPEQGISGPFRITTIKHLLPQKRPEDEDAGKGFVFRPVTGIFIPTTK
jgi:broad specificity polyphosphatase/5'/3'-nucleotidase SurE